MHDDIPPLQLKWITAGADKALVRWAEDAAKYWTSQTAYEAIVWDAGAVDWDQSIEKHREAIPFTISQLRRFFGQLKKVQVARRRNRSSVVEARSVDVVTEEEDFYLALTQLAYAVGRTCTNEEKYYKISSFYKQMERAFGPVTKAMDEQDQKQTNRYLDNLIHVLEAIVAYHKVHEITPE